MREFSLLDIIKYYLKHFWIVLLITILSACIGQLYINKCFVPSYEESSTIILGTGGDDNLEISYSTLSLYDSLIKNYMELLESKKLLSSVNKELKLNYSVDELSAMVSYTIYDEAQMVKISVKNKNDKKATDICNMLVKKLKEQVQIVYGMNNITVVDKASTTGNLSYSKNKILIISVILGIFLSSFIIIVRYIFSNSLANTNTLKLPNIAILGKVKFSRDKKEPKLDININEIEKENFRNVRAKLINQLESNKVILISSIKDNLSKSYVSFNLAQIVSSTLKKVLLIDINSKDGLITKSFFANKNGLLETLKNEEVLEKVKYNISNIDVIPLGNCRNEIDLLASSQFENTLKKLEEEYDYIFIDSPSFDNNFEPYAMLKLIDGIILVSTYKNNIRQITKIEQKAKSAKKEVLGIIFTKTVKIKPPKESKKLKSKNKNKPIKKKNIIKKLMKKINLPKKKKPAKKKYKKITKSTKTKPEKIKAAKTSKLPAKKQTNRGISKAQNKSKIKTTKTAKQKI